MTKAWPYSTHDDVSHLACSDVDVLRARIDQLLEERHELRKALGLLTDVRIPLSWKLTPIEARFFGTLVNEKGELTTKERLHAAMGGDNPEYDADIKIVDVVACKVRKKLKPHGIVFETVWGRGYRLSPEVRASFLEPRQ